MKTNRRSFLVAAGAGLLVAPVAAGTQGRARRPECDRIPDRIRVKPVFLVPSDGPAPTAAQRRALMGYLRAARDRYGELLGGHTFDLAADEPQTVSIDKPLAYFNALPFPNSGDNTALARMFEADNVDRYSCPFLYVVALAGVRRPEIFTGGTINGGANNGGGIVVMDAERLVDGKTGGSPRGFLSIVIHEIGHASGLVHCDAYGYSMQDSHSYMSTSAERTLFLPEELRVLAMNQRVFPGYAFDPKRDTPDGYKMASEAKFQASPIRLEGRWDETFRPVHFRSLGAALLSDEITVELVARVAKGGPTSPNPWDQCLFEVNAHREDEEANSLMARGPRPDGTFFWDCGDWKRGGRLVWKGALPDGATERWQPLAFVASRRLGRMLIYRDGQLVAQKDGVSPFRSGDQDLYVGCGRFPFNGEIREFRVWDHARSEADIGQNRDRVLSGNERGLVAYYRARPPVLT